jgi:hypothetical protein
MEPKEFIVDLYSDYSATGKQKEIEEHKEEARDILKKRLALWSPAQNNSWVEETARFIELAKGSANNYLDPTNTGPGIKRLMVKFSLNESDIRRQIPTLDLFDLPELDSIREGGERLSGGYIRAIKKLK